MSLTPELEASFAATLAHADCPNGMVQALAPLQNRLEVLWREGCDINRFLPMLCPDLLLAATSPRFFNLEPEFLRNRFHTWLEIYYEAYRQAHEPWQEELAARGLIDVFYQMDYFVEPPIREGFGPDPVQEPGFPRKFSPRADHHVQFDGFDGAFLGPMQIVRFQSPAHIALCALHVEFQEWAIAQARANADTPWPLAAFDHCFAPYAAMQVNPEQSHEAMSHYWALSQTPSVGFEQAVTGRIDGQLPPEAWDSPVVQAMARLWDQLLADLLVQPSAVLAGYLARAALKGDEASCTAWQIPWKSNYFQTLAQTAPNYLPPAPPSAPPPLPTPWPAQDMPQLHTLFDGKFFVMYGWVMWQPEADECIASETDFAGQRNGILGAARAGALTLRTGLHTGDVALRVLRCDTEPPLPDESWTEVVEASVNVPEHAAMTLSDAEGLNAEPAAIEPGTYRARLASARYGLAEDGPLHDPQGELLERYTLVLWPEPSVRPDALLRAKHARAKSWHGLQAGEPSVTVDASGGG